MLILQAPVIAAMVALVFGWIRVPFAEQHAASTKELSFVLVIAVLWCSGTLSVRELVKERTVFRHESRHGIDIGPYIASKVLFLGALAMLQACILLAIVRSFTGLTGDVALQTILLALTALTGVTLGLGHIRCESIGRAGDDPAAGFINCPGRVFQWFRTA